MKLKKKAKLSPGKSDTRQSETSTPQKRKPEAKEDRNDHSPPEEKRLKTSSTGTIVDRLRGFDPVGALKEVVAEGEGGDDHDALMGEFLSNGGQAGDLLRLLESEKKTKTQCLIVDKRAEKLCFAVFVAFNLTYWIYLLSPQKPKTLIVQ